MKKTAKAEKDVLTGQLDISKTNLSVATDDTTKLLERNKIQFIKQQISIIERKILAIRLHKSTNKAIQIIQNWNGDQTLNNRT